MASLLTTASNVAEKAKTMVGGESKKVAQLAADTKDVHDKSWKMTSDYGVKQSNTDDWLAVASEDKQGPQLLEDHFGREKVSLPRSATTTYTDLPRSTASTTNVSPSVSSTPVVPVPLASSRSSSPPRMSPLLVSSLTRPAPPPSSCDSRPSSVAVALPTLFAMSEASL
jgi:hypothetical protein